jgi:glycosyltransferase involved in cell wall biosynthesis
MFINKADEESLKIVIEGVLAEPFEGYAKQSFEARHKALQNVLLYVRNMTVETDEDAAFRLKAVDFTDKLLLSLASDSIRFATEGHYKDVYTLSPNVPFTNQELIKEKNLNGYFLSKLTGGEHHFAFGSFENDYPYLRYIPDMDFPILRPDEFTADTYREYIIQNANKMDILILPFPCNAAAFYEDIYRKNRGDGKIIITADTNRRRMIRHYTMLPELVQHFFARANVVTVPSHDLRDQMNGNKENKFPVFTLRHSFANATGEDVTVTATDKENIILTVANLSTHYKNIPSLIEGFSRAAELLPDWKLVLVGEYPENLQKFINLKYAQIKNRVIITGDLDKPALYKWYARAKIFCMSTFCDSSPLVCSEAMAFGCYQVLSDCIDGAADLTRNGEFGVIYEQEKYVVETELFRYERIEGYSGEAEQNLANALIETAHKLDYNFFKTFIEKSKKLQQTEFSYEVNARILGLLLFT